MLCISRLEKCFQKYQAFAIGPQEVMSSRSFQYKVTYYLLHDLQITSAREFDTPRLLSFSTFSRCVVTSRQSPRRVLNNLFLISLRKNLFLIRIKEIINNKYSVRKVFLELSQYSQKNTCGRVSSPFIKIETLAQAFSFEFCKISKNTFFYRTPPVAASEDDIRLSYFQRFITRLCYKALYNENINIISSLNEISSV